MPWTVETRLRGKRAEDFLRIFPDKEVQWEESTASESEDAARKDYEERTGYDCAVRLLDPDGKERARWSPE